MSDDIVRVRCVCGRTYKIPKLSSKKRIRCSQCHAIIAVPAIPADQPSKASDSSTVDAFDATISNHPDRGPMPVQPVDSVRELRVALLADIGFTIYSLAQMAYLYSLIPSRHSFLLSGEIDRHSETRDVMGFAITLSCALALFNGYAVFRELKRNRNSFRLLFTVLFASVPVQIMRIGGFFTMIDRSLLFVDSGDPVKVGSIVLIGLLAVSYDVAWFLMLRRLRSTRSQKSPQATVRETAD